MSTANTLREFWSARAPREQRILSVGAGLLLLVLIGLLLIEPAIEGRARWQQALPTLRSQLAQMRAMASEISALRANTASKASVGAAAEWSRASLERSLKDKGLEFQQLSVGDSGDSGDSDVSLNLINVSFAVLAEWLQQTQSSTRLTVTEATITARDLTGRVDARLTLQRPQ